MRLLSKYTNSITERGVGYSMLENIHNSVVPRMCTISTMLVCAVDLSYSETY